MGVQAGEVPARVLLQMAERVVAAMQPSTVAVHADALFGFLQRALDVRQHSPASMSDPAVVEGAAVSALVTATMKLSEKQFKPLFLQLLAWSSTAPAGLPGALWPPCMSPALILHRPELIAIKVILSD